MKYYAANNELPGAHSQALVSHDRTRFHRSHHFDLNGCSVPALQQGKAGIGGEPLRNQPKDIFKLSGGQEERLGWSKPEEAALGPPGLPNWIKKEKQVLRFYSYFMDNVSEHSVEAQRLRRCIICYYLEDETVQVMEPPQPNSGIPQGTLVRRHRVPYTYMPHKEAEDKAFGNTRPGPWNRTYPKSHITHWDLNVQRSIIIYGRLHRIVDCDKFTREFLEGIGVSVPSPEPEPEDVYSGQRAKVEATQPLRPYKRISKPSSGSDAPVILRFFGAWEDKSRPVSEARHLSIHMYLDDESVEVVEMHDTNCGRYKAPMFLKRAKLKKDVSKLVQLPGLDTNHTLLNVVRSKGPGRIRDAVLIDNLETKPETNLDFSDEGQYYRLEDLNIGEVISVNGRQVLLYDCDKLTKNFYREHFGRDMQPLPDKPTVRHKPNKYVPPYNGFGTEADSLTSCNGLEPRAPQRDFDKFMNKDRDGFESYVLRYSARLVRDSDQVDMTRKFVISYFLSDDTILVHQFPEMNTGFSSGRFLHKSKIPKPQEEQSPDEAVARVFYTSQDLYVGALVIFHDHTFLITEADDYVFDYMERAEETEKYPQSSIRLILERLDQLLESARVKELMSSFMEWDPKDTGNISQREFRSVLRDFLGFHLSEHQLITLTRYYRCKDLRADRLPRHRLVSLLQSDLKRLNFNTYSELLQTLQSKDGSAKGTVPRDVMRNTLVAAFRTTKAQAKGQQIRALIDALMEHEPDQVSYEDIIHELDWSKNPTVPVAPEPVKANFYESPLQHPTSPIDYRKLIAHLEEKKDIQTAKKIEELEVNMSGL